MRLAIIGAGNVGSSLAEAAAKAGHNVTLSAAHPAHAVEVAGKAGATPAASNAEAVEGADVLVLAVPHAAVAEVAGELGSALAGKVVVDVTNPLDAAYTDLVTEGVSAAEVLQREITGSSVVKAFNTVFAARYANPTENGSPLDAFLAGDDAAAKATVADLASSIGFRPIDAGGLRMARSLEELALLNITLNARNGWPWQSAWKLAGPTQAG